MATQPSSAAAAAPTQHSRFLSLSGEMRNAIYEYYLHDPSTLACTEDCRMLEPSLTLVSREVRKEVLSMWLAKKLDYTAVRTLKFRIFNNDYAVLSHILDRKKKKKLKDLERIELCMVFRDRGQNTDLLRHNGVRDTTVDTYVFQWLYLLHQHFKTIWKVESVWKSTNELSQWIMVAICREGDSGEYHGISESTPEQLLQRQLYVDDNGAGDYSFSYTKWVERQQSVVGQLEAYDDEVD